MVKLTSILLEITDKQVAGDIAGDIADIFKQELETAEKQANEGEQLDEALLTTAALLLSIPGLLKGVAKIAERINAKYYKGFDLSRTDNNAWYSVLERFAEKIDSYIGVPFDTLLKPIIKDAAKRKKAVDFLKAACIVTMAVIGSVDLSATKTALNTVKEIGGSLAGELIQSAGENNLPKVIEFVKQNISTILK